MGKWRITGAWSKAGIASCIKVEGTTKSEKILLDCGLLDEACISVPLVLITHGHTDHIGACISHARARSLGMSPATYVVPPSLMEPLLNAQKAFEAMNDNGPIPMIITPLSPHESMMWGKSVKIMPFETIHRTASQGYAIFNVAPGQLLPQYRNLKRSELESIKSSGTKIYSEQLEVLDIVYTGDTTFAAFLLPQNSFIFAAPTLITEVTFLDGEREKAERQGHVHLQDILDHIEHFLNREIVLMHFSARYAFGKIIDILSNELPSDVIDRISLALYTFGSRDYLTALANPSWAKRARTEAGWGWASRASHHPSGPIENIHSALPPRVRNDVSRITAAETSGYEGEMTPETSRSAAKSDVLNNCDTVSIRETSRGFNNTSSHRSGSGSR
jgi:ribonuclease Z